MNSQKYHSFSIVMLVELYPALGILLGLTLVLLLQTSSDKVCIQFPSAPDRGIPERTNGAGTRVTIQNPINLANIFRLRNSL
ncbi:MAG: hypothetical protein RLZZ507_1057 [Cyanobacteriota bacterium]|jgi:hypothetical protein